MNSSSSDIKALILAAGRGRRLNELCPEVNKCMIEIKGKPLIEISLDSAALIPEIREIIIVVGYQAESIINRYGNAYNGKSVRYCIQKEQKGLVHAIESAERQIDGSDFMLFLGDEIVLGAYHAEMINKFRDKDIFAICGVVKEDSPERIGRTYTIAQSEDSTIYRLVEKPKTPFNKWMGTGNCLFRNSILRYADKVPLHYIRNEKELPDLIQCAIDDGRIVKSFNLCDYYININSAGELAEVEADWEKINNSIRQIERGLR